MAFAKTFQFLFPFILFAFCVCNVDFKLPYMKILKAINLKLTLFLMKKIYNKNFSEDEIETSDLKKTS